MSFEDLIIKVNEKVKESDLINHIVMIIDRSGSMSTLQIEVPGAFNRQLKDLKEISSTMKTTVSLVTFETVVDKPIFWKKDINNVRDMKDDDYKLGGLTALYDAIGTTINKLNMDEDADDIKTSYLVVIITDGCENSSKEYNGKKIVELMNKMKETNRWTFSFIGSNFDVDEVSKDLGIAGTNTMYFAQQNANIGYVGASPLNGVSGRSGVSGTSGNSQVLGYTNSGMTATNSLDSAMNSHSTSVKTYMDNRKNIQQDIDGSFKIFTATNTFYNDAPKKENKEKDKYNEY